VARRNERRGGDRRAPPPAVPVIGHGQLLKALNMLPGCTDQRFRIAAVYLAHAAPPELTVFPKTKTVARLVGCTTRSVELCRKWLEENDAVAIARGGGRGRSTSIDFEPLARRVNSEAAFAVCPMKPGETAKAESQRANGGVETAKPPSASNEKDPSSRTPYKDRADARASEAARASRDEPVERGVIGTLKRNWRARGDAEATVQDRSQSACAALGMIARGDEDTVILRNTAISSDDLVILRGVRS
jgi:hypothetical protein